MIGSALVTLQVTPVSALAYGSVMWLLAVLAPLLLLCVICAVLVLPFYERGWTKWAQRLEAFSLWLMLLMLAILVIWVFRLWLVLIWR